jgi:hypothetical protein
VSLRHGRRPELRGYRWWLNHTSDDHQRCSRDQLRRRRRGTPTPEPVRASAGSAWPAVRIRPSQSKDCGWGSSCPSLSPNQRQRNRPTFGVAENTVRLSAVRRNLVPAAREVHRRIPTAVECRWRRESASAQFPTFCRGSLNIRPRLPMGVWRQPTSCHCLALPGPQPMKSQKAVGSSPGGTDLRVGHGNWRELTVSDRADDLVIPDPVPCTWWHERTRRSVRSPPSVQVKDCHYDSDKQRIPAGTERC